MEINAVDVLKIETEKLKVPALKHHGVRFFFPSGEVVAMSTCDGWNNYLTEKVNKLEEKRHYTSELSISDIKNSYCVIRPSGLITPYIQALKDFEMSNSLIIYQRLPTMIVGYYFIPKADDYQAFQYFLNNLSIFQNLIFKVSGIINSGKYCNNTISLNQKYKLLDSETVTTLVKANVPLFQRPASRKFIIFGHEYAFTSKQIDVLKLLRYTSVVKEITAYLNKDLRAFGNKEVSTRVVEWYIQNIRKEIQCTSSLDIRTIATEVIKFI